MHGTHGHGASGDDDVVWLTAPNGAPESAAQGAGSEVRRRRSRVGIVPVLAIALAGSVVAALHLHDTSVALRTEAATAARQSERATAQLAAAETRIAQLEDILERTERARWETRVELDAAQGRVTEAVDACTASLGSAVSILVRHADPALGRRHVQHADEACSAAAVLYEDLIQKIG